MKLIESIFLTFKNICLSEVIKVYECYLFGNTRWWWKLNYYHSVLYLSDTRYRIVLRERKKQGPYSLVNYTSGETPLITIMRIFQGINSGDTLPFIDLGSGRGYAIFGASLLFNCPTVGVEILPGYVKKCEIMREKLGIENMEIYSCDMLSMPINRRGIYYCAATALDITLLEALEQKLAEAPSGSWVVMVHHPLTSSRFQKAYKGEEILPFTWGWDTVYVYKIEDPPPEV